MNSDREKLISELDDYIATCKERLANILSVLGWNEEDTLQENSSPSSGRRHSTPVGQKLVDAEPPLPESLDCKHSIVIDEETMKEILKTSNVHIPQKFSDIQLNFTREQKRELYDYVIFNTGRISEPELKVKVPGENRDDDDMTLAEIVAKAKKKDKKLKRKYRTSKPTHIEEVRHLVHLQMEALEQYFKPTKRKSRSCSPVIRKDKHQRRKNDRSRSRDRPSSSHTRHKSSKSDRHRRKHTRSRSRSRSTRKQKHSRRHR